MIKLMIECENSDDLAAITGFLGGRPPARRGCGVHQMMQITNEDKKRIDDMFHSLLQVMAEDLGLVDEKDDGPNDQAKDAAPVAPPEPSPDVIEPSVGDAFNVCFPSTTGCAIDPDADADAAADSAPVLGEDDPYANATMDDAQSLVYRIQAKDGKGMEKARALQDAFGIKRMNMLKAEQIPAFVRMGERMLAE